jgi:ABC-type nitrate/sulfonate/bicarbonate transport system permease component
MAQHAQHDATPPIPLNGAARSTGRIRTPRSWLAVYAPPFVLAVLLLAAWEGLVRWLALPAWLLPAPSQIASTFVDQLAVLRGHVGATLVETALGMLVSLVVGFGLAFAIDAAPLVRRALYPLLVASQTVPIVAIAPLLVIGLGFGLLPKVLVVALITFFPIVVNTVDGLQSADRDAVRLFQAMNASRWQTLRLLRIPAALPTICTGLKLAVTYSVIGAVFAEWIGANAGLGVYIARSLRAFRTDQVFVAAFVTALLSIVLFSLTAALERKLTPWDRD